MSRLTGALFVLGVLLVGLAGMMAVDSYMNDTRKDSVRAEINGAIDDAADRYETRKEEGCRRGRCGLLGTLAHTWAGLRDGVFSKVSIDPEAALPVAPKGWRMAPYDLATVEAIVGQKIRQTKLASDTSNRLLMHMNKVASAKESGAVRIYQDGSDLAAMAISVSRAALKGKTPPRYPVTLGPKLSGLALNGIPLKLHKALSLDPLEDKTTPVRYRHYSMDLDGMVFVTLLIRSAGSPQDMAATLLQHFDLDSIVAELPNPPAGYQGPVAHAAAQGQ